jgi:hypothetical protein
VKETIIKCDVCKSQEDVNQEEMQMLRHFDSSDGRSFSDHFVTETIDLCKQCLDANLKSGKYLIDERVQGYGNIVLKE